MVKLMKKLTFQGGWNYENKSYITTGFQDEPILVKKDVCCKFYIDTVFYIGTNKELTTLWQKLEKDENMFTLFQTPNFTKNEQYCIEICKQDESGKHDPALCYIPKVANICWDFYRDITPFEKMEQDKQDLYLIWLQDHIAWEAAQRKKN